MTHRGSCQRIGDKSREVIGGSVVRRNQLYFLRPALTVEPNEISELSNSTRLLYNIMVIYCSPWVRRPRIHPPRKCEITRQIKSCLRGVSDAPVVACRLSDVSSVVDDAGNPSRGRAVLLERIAVPRSVSKRRRTRRLVCLPICDYVIYQCH